MIELEYKNLVFEYRNIRERGIDLGWGRTKGVKGEVYYTKQMGKIRRFDTNTRKETTSSRGE